MLPGYVACCVTCYLVCYLLIVTCYLFAVACYLVVVTCYLVVVTCYLLLLPVTWFVTCYLTCYLTCKPKSVCLTTIFREESSRRERELERGETYEYMPDEEKGRKKKNKLCASLI